MPATNGSVRVKAQRLRGRMSKCTGMCWRMRIIDRCVCITPFGEPVVPMVYPMIVRSSACRETTGTSGRAAAINDVHTACAPSHGEPMAITDTAASVGRSATRSDTLSV